MNRKKSNHVIAIGYEIIAFIAFLIIGILWFVPEHDQKR